MEHPDLEKPSQQQTEAVYYVHNTTRSVHTRALRQAHPGRPKLTQRLAGGDLVVKRGRPRALSESEVRRCLTALQAGVASGALRVLDAAGRQVDLTRNFAPLTEDVPGVRNSPLPVFVPDSANNDVNPERPGRVSENVGHSLDPSPFAQGALPELLRPTLEQNAEEAEGLGESDPPVVAGEDQEAEGAVAPTLPPTATSASAQSASAPATVPAAQQGKKGKKR